MKNFFKILDLLTENLLYKFIILLTHNVIMLLLTILILLFGLK